MAEQDPISTEDAIAIAKKVGKMASLGRDAQSRKQLLMCWLKELTEADGWLCSMKCSQENDNPMSARVFYEGLTDLQFAGWMEANQTSRLPLPGLSLSGDSQLSESLVSGKHCTRTRDQLVGDDEWYNHPAVKKYHLERGLDDFLCSVYSFNKADARSTICLYRHVGREKFSARHRRITHIILSSADWLHSALLPECHRPEFQKPEFQRNGASQLTPAQRAVLVYLLDGMRRSEIAKAMAISENTARDHIRAVLRSYEVKDQLELVCLFRDGNGLDEA